jgi:two-component system CheB/CheR fusion protein
MNPRGPANAEFRPVQRRWEPQQAKRALFPIVGVGASAGGLEAFTQLLKALASGTGMAYVLVQHLDPSHESALTELLAKATEMPVSQVTDATPVQPDHVYVIPPNVDMIISKGILRLTPRSETRGYHMPIDRFLRSLAEDQRSNAIGVILSGTASDGTLGLAAIKAEEGITFAQDEKSAKFDGMPQSAIAAGCVDFVLPPDAIGRELARIRSHPYLASSSSSRTAALVPDDDPELKNILHLLRTANEVDFSDYKPATVKRRILRRMALHQIGRLKEYAEFLRHHPTEVEALHEDLLIKVTSFFRDPAAFEALRIEVFPGILKHRSLEEPLRIWVPGCSTGEETYSQAIALLEFLGNSRAETPVQLFGTDLSQGSIEKARAGIYPESIAADVSPIQRNDEDALTRAIVPLATKYGRLPTDYGAVAKCGVAGGQGSGAVHLAARRAESTRQATTQGKTVAGGRLVCTAEAGAGESCLELRLCQCHDPRRKDASHSDADR